MSLESVELTDLERDDRIDEVVNNFIRTLPEESGFAKLKKEQQEAVEAILDTLRNMRFEGIDGFQKVVTALLQGIAPELERYVPIAIDNAKATLQEKKGVLVIYTGGTIGSAPKDMDDPDSPQVVKPWRDLKLAAPKLGLLGYPVDAIAFVNPLDSCNVGPPHWHAMVNIIEKHYDDYTGFVILHGTDSMSYTASALSFMMLYLSKPVVITGSQIAGITNPRNDAHQNMITAIMLANPMVHNLPLISEVIVAFGNLFIRGNRTKKMNVVEYQGFNSPNYPLIGKAGDHIVIERKNIRSVDNSSVQFHKKMDTNVIIVEVFPGMQNSQVLANILKDGNLRGVVLKAYGAGNIPTDALFLDLFSAFIERGGVVVCTTSCPAGEVVMGLYETSQVLLDRGIIGGFDITPEAALCKLMVLLGEDDYDLRTVKQLMQQSIAGEQRLSLESTFLAGEKKLEADGKAVAVEGELASVPEESRIEKVMLRFMHAQLQTGQNEDPDYRATIRISLESAMNEQSDQYLGTFSRRRVPENALVGTNESVGESLTVDLTRNKHLFLIKESAGRIKAKQKVKIHVALAGDSGAAFAWKGAELNIYTHDQ
ncbi:MAG: asparaginase [Magnetococcales bacterium]|nr:asparaginase [Magnetococcales bacterium]